MTQQDNPKNTCGYDVATRMKLFLILYDAQFLGLSQTKNSI